MSDKEIGGSDDLSLPKATVAKIIAETLSATATENQNMTFAKETRDLLTECSVEFITMISTEANEIAERNAKKTISSVDIEQALQDLGFGEYVPELSKTVDEFKTGQAHREKKYSKIERSGLSADELARMQDELFRSAGEKFNAGAGE